VSKPALCVIGTGYLGKLHARVLSQMENVDVVGFVERDDTAAADIEQTLGLRRFRAVEEIAPHVQGAVIATPTTTHFEVAMQLLEAGADLMIEKPITSTVEDARELLRVAREKKKIIQVGHVERYNPAIAASVPFIEAPRYLEAERLGVFVGRSLDVDVLLDLMIHDLNLVLSLVPHQVVKIDAVGVPVLTQKVDIANVRLEFDNGAVANLTASRVSSDRVRKFRVFGSDLYLSIDTREQEVKGYRLRQNGDERKIEPLDIRPEKKEPLRAELESFAECVVTRKEPLVTGEDGLAALELAIRVGEAIDQSVAQFRA
jgi:predicted dehydrogenase